MKCKAMNILVAVDEKYLETTRAADACSCDGIGGYTEHERRGGAPLQI